MREILFRAKRLGDGEWVDGNLFIPDKPDYDTEICCGTNVVRINYAVDPNTVGQHIGHKDVNGLRIYEGDIVEETECCSGEPAHRYVITSVDSGFYYTSVEIHRGDYSACYVGDDDIGVFMRVYNCKVIGNIYDNPELLEDEK